MIGNTSHGKLKSIPLTDELYVLLGITLEPAQLQWIHKIRVRASFAADEGRGKR